MAYQVNLGWHRYSVSPLFDQGYKGGGRPIGGGGSYTITGTGFGSYSGSSSFEDFENETIGIKTSLQGFLEMTAANSATSVTDQDSVSGSKSLAHDFSLQLFPLIHKTLSGTSNRAYLSCHLKYDSNVVGTGSLVWKLARVGSGTVYSGVPRASSEYTSSGGSDVPQSLSALIANSDGTTSFSANNQATADPATTITNRTWHFYECELYCGTIDNSDAVFIERFNGVETLRFENRPYLTTANSLLPSWFLTPLNGHGQSDPEILAYMDDVYVDEAHARVVMTDNAVYANSTQFAVQPISSFSDTSVAVTPKRQGFAVGATAYLHLFNSSGVLVSEGNQITVEAD